MNFIFKTWIREQSEATHCNHGLYFQHLFRNYPWLRLRPLKTNPLILWWHMLIKAKKVDLHTCAFVSLSEHFYLYLIKYGYHSCSLVRIVYDKFLMFSQGIQRIFIARMMRYWCSMQQRYHHYQPRHIHVRFYSTCKIISSVVWCYKDTLPAQAL